MAPVPRAMRRLLGARGDLSGLPIQHQVPSLARGQQQPQQPRQWAQQMKQQPRLQPPQQWPQQQSWQLQQPPPRQVQQLQPLPQPTPPQPSQPQQQEDMARFDAPSKCVGLSLEQALALQDELIDAYVKEDFQQRLHGAWESCDRPSRREVRRREVCLEAHGPVLARYGFEGSAKGMFALAVEFDRDFPDVHEIHMKAKMCRWLTQPEAGVWQELGSSLAACFADRSHRALRALDQELDGRLERSRGELRGTLR